ncbi:MAG: LytTR family DNA-binding domain-containing protein [Acidobacteriota bacterium]|nr:LytTR family DNA-binding domain-containing protein [Acidobacteriota bacterium]
MIRIIIVDDEPLARSGIVTRLGRQPDCEVVASCASAEEAQMEIQKHAPDLVFLDIWMTGLSGIELMESLPGRDHPAIILLTAHEQYAVEAFRHEALDYLLKPVDDERLAEALNRARRLLALRERAGTRSDPVEEGIDVIRQGSWMTRFTVRTRRNVKFVKARNVDWIEGLGDYVGLHEGQTTHLVRVPLSFLGERLDPAHFLRIHRSAIVNVDRILNIARLVNQDSIVTLASGQELRASRTYYEALKKRM